MKYIKDFIINSIRERDKSVYQTHLRLWRLGHIKKPNKPKSLILLPSKLINKLIPYKHEHKGEILGVFRDEGKHMKTIYLSPEYTNVVFINE